MVSNEDFENAVGLINKSSGVLVTTHTKPDGDACGSIAAICDVLADLGKEVSAVLPSKEPEWYGFLFDEKPAVLGEDVEIEQLKEEGFDLIVLIDVNSNSQLPEFGGFLEENDSPVLVIDHHLTSDGLGDVELVDSSAAASGLIVLELFKYAGWDVTGKIAEALFVAIATDTGWFRFRNTDGAVFGACTELIEAGADPTQIYHNLYQNLSLGRLKLMGVMLETLELHLDGRYATQQLLGADFERTGAEYKDTENLIDECRRVGTVEVAALFVETGDGRVKCSLRSTGAIDVRKIAQRFGGGGHKTAAGVHLEGPVEGVKELIFEQVREQFAQIDSK